MQDQDTTQDQVNEVIDVEKIFEQEKRKNERRQSQLRELPSIHLKMTPRQASTRDDVYPDP